MLGLAYFVCVAVSIAAASRVFDLQLGDLVDASTISRLRIGLLASGLWAPWSDFTTACVWGLFLALFGRLLSQHIRWSSIFRITLVAEIVFVAGSALVHASIMFFWTDWHKLQVRLMGTATLGQMNLFAFAIIVLSPASLLWLFYVRNALVRRASWSAAVAWVVAVAVLAIRAATSVAWANIGSS